MEFNKTDLFSMVKRDKAILIVIFSIASLVVVAALYVAYNSYAESKKNIYLLDRGQAFRLMLEQNNIMEDRKAEAQAHVRHALELMLTVVPDPDRIKYNLSKLGFMAGDNSVKSFVDNLKAKGFYNNMIAYNQHQTTYVDNINLKDIPGGFMAIVKGRNRRVSASDITESDYTIACLLRAVPRSNNNPDGFLIEKFRLQEATGLKKIRR